MLELVAIGGGCLLLGFALGFKARGWEVDATLHTIEDFARLFPGKCAVCSFWRYGRNNGLDVRRPGPHACPEAR